MSHKAKIVCVTAQKGGVGKTTLACNTAACLANTGRKILVIDLDPQFHLSATICPEYKTSIKDVLYSRDLAKPPLIERVIYESVVPGLDIIPASGELMDADIRLGTRVGKDFLLKRVLDKVSDRYDLVLIDTPSHFGVLVTNAFTAADSLVIPIFDEVYSLRGLNQVMKMIVEVKATVNPPLNLGEVVMTNHNPRTLVGKAVKSEIVSFFDTMKNTLEKKQIENFIAPNFPNVVCDTTIPQNIRFKEAPGHKMPISEYAPECTGTIAYENLSRELMTRWGL